MNTWIYIIPFLSAIVGWLISITYITVVKHRYLPIQKSKLVEILVESVNNFSPLQMLQTKLSDASILSKAMPMIEKHIDEFLTIELPKEIPMLGMFVGNKTIDKIKEVFLLQLKALFPKVMLSMTDNLNNTLNLRALIENQLDSPDVSAKVDQAMTSYLNKLRLLLLLAGFVIGCINLVFFLIVWR